MTAALGQLHLRGDTQVLQVSPLYRSAAVGPPQPDYINACALIETVLSPHELREQHKQLEASQGRDHSADRWTARPLDIDILLYDQLSLKDELLTIPHPEIYHRDFVLVPLLDLDANLRLPDGQQLAEILKNISVKSLKPISPPVEIMDTLTRLT